MLKYPIPKEKRIHLIRIYLHLATLPGMPIHIVATVSDGLQVLTRSKKKLTIEDLRLPWKPLFNIIDNDLFLSRRQFEIRCVISLLSMRQDTTVYAVAKYRGTWDISRITSGGFFTLLQSKKCCPRSSRG
jgi:hypothetical protein